MSPMVLTFAGPIGSGKSTLSRNIARDLGWAYASFGDYVRQIALQNDRGNSREVLQDTGASIVKELGWDPFCSSVLAQATWETGKPLVVDGIRHVEALQALNKITAPSKVSLVFIDVDESDIEARASRKPLHEDRSHHSTEEQVYSILPGLADLRVDGSNTVEDLVREIVTWVRDRSYVC